MLQAWRGVNGDGTMRVRGVSLGVLAAYVAVALAGGLATARAQSGPAPPGAVGMLIGLAETNPDPVVALVGVDPVHLSEVGDAIRTMPAGGAGNPFETLYPVALRRLIAHQALVIRAHAEGLDEDRTVRRHMQEAVNAVLANAYLRRAAAKMVTDQMLTARYDAEIRSKPGPEEVHGQAILVPTQAEAQDIIAKLAAGADFAVLARQSESTAVSAIGGDLGFVRQEALGPEVGAVLFALRPGEVTPYPVHTGLGWFVLRTEARRLAPTPTFSEVRDRLEAGCEADNVAAVEQAALDGMSVRAFDMTGH
jgi:peptidyl-prolyl cis-trans isomerase C